jgi:hypothetical protein
MQNLKYFIAAPLIIGGSVALYELATGLTEKPSLDWEHWTEDDWLAGFFAAIMLTTGIYFFVSLHRRTAGLVSGKTLERLREKGRSARAEILELEDTGMTVNDDPVLQVSLRVHDGALPPYQVRIKQLVSRLAAPQLTPGSTADVLVDPANPRIVALNL